MPYANGDVRLVVAAAGKAFQSAPSSPRIFLQDKKDNEIILDKGQREITTAVDDEASAEEILDRLCAMFPTSRRYDVKELLAK